MRPPKSENRDTRQAVIEASFHLFTTRGYSAASMRDIAAEAGITAGSIYNHFADKEKIFTAVCLAYHPAAKVLPLLSEVEGQTAEDLIRGAARRVVAEMEENPGVFNLVAVEITELGGKHMEELVTEMLPHVQQFLSRVYSSGAGLRPRDPLTFFRAFLGILLGYGITRIALQRTGGPNASSATLDDFIDIFLRGVLAE